MKRSTPTALAARTSGKKASWLIEAPRPGSSSKEGSLEMQARWMTASQPSSARATASGSRMSPLTWRSFGSSATAASVSP
jgi:hypothetical protein